MKLAEALIERAELQRKNAQLLGRITSNTMVQQGDSPAEEPQVLLAEYEGNMQRLQLLIQQINRTNGSTVFEGAESITDAIARRDCLGARIRTYRAVYESATIRQERCSGREVKFVRCMDVGRLQADIDRLSKQYRELDTRLQALTWTVELLEG